MSEGGILVFVTGREEVQTLCRKLRRRFPGWENDQCKHNQIASGFIIVICLLYFVEQCVSSPVPVLLESRTVGLGTDSRYARLDSCFTLCYTSDL